MIRSPGDATVQGQRSVASVLIGRESYEVTSSSVNTIVIRVSNPNRKFQKKKLVNCRNDYQLGLGLGLVTLMKVNDQRSPTFCTDTNVI